MNCRLCARNIQKPFLSLGHSPLANAFLVKKDLSKMEPFYPLDVYVCGKCFLVQIKQFEKPEDIFSSDYPYFSSYSKTWLSHCQEYTNKIIKKLKLNHKSFVIEIGSNDGCLLQNFKKRDIPVLGIEPAKNTALVAKNNNIPTKTVFFNSKFARQQAKKSKADLIIANNVLAHNPNLLDFVKGIKMVLKKDGTATLEFPHLLQLMSNNQFDTIYHEHFSYFSLNTIIKLFNLFELIVYDVEEINIHGGSLRIYVEHDQNKNKQKSDKISIILEKEKKLGLNRLKTYNHFSSKVVQIKRELLLILIRLKKQNKRIIAYGAPAKGNTLLNYCGIRSDFLEYVVDANPHKQNKYLPGTHLLVESPAVIKKDRPDYVLILPWNIKDEIRSRLSYIKEWHGRFIIPIPKPKVVK